MIDFNKKIEEFKKLSFKEKYEKVLKMVEMLKWDDLFDSFYELLLNLKEDVSEDLLVNIYSMIIEALVWLEKDDKEKETNKMKKLKEKLLKIRQQEQAQQEDVEDLLKNI